MVEMLESLFIPNVGGYDAGAVVELDEKLEAQLIASGKAKPSKRKTEKVVDMQVHPKVEPSLTDD